MYSKPHTINAALPKGTLEKTIFFFKYICLFQIELLLSWLNLSNFKIRVFQTSYQLLQFSKTPQIIVAALDWISEVQK